MQTVYHTFSSPGSTGPLPYLLQLFSWQCSTRHPPWPSPGPETQHLKERTQRIKAQRLRRQLPATSPDQPRDPGHTALVILGSDPLIYETGKKAFSPVSQVVKIDQDAKVLCQHLPVAGTCKPVAVPDSGFSDGVMETHILFPPTDPFWGG